MFRIGECSNVLMTAMTQRRSYDEIGFFQPEYTNQLPGYRSYTMAQVPKQHLEQEVRAEIMRRMNSEIHLSQIPDSGKLPQDTITRKRLPTTAFLGYRLGSGVARCVDVSL